MMSARERIMIDLEFDLWANQTVSASLQNADPLPEKAKILFSHIHNVSSAWIRRITKNEVPIDLFELRPLDADIAQMNENFRLWTRFFDSIQDSDVDSKFDFFFPLDGTYRTISYYETAQHIIHHSSYHRGQIIMLLKGSIESVPNPGRVLFSSKARAD